MSRESIDDDEDGTPGPESLIFDSFEAVDGAHKFIVTPTTAAFFYLNISAVDTSGNDIPGEVELDVFMEPRTPREFTATLNFSPGSTMTVVRSITFAILRASLHSAFTLGQLGDAKLAAKLDKILAEGERALSRKSAKDKHDGGKEAAVEKLREFIKKLEKAAKGEKDDDDEDEKRFVSVQALASLRGDALTLNAQLKPHHHRDDDKKHDHIAPAKKDGTRRGGGENDR
ncbi:MAG: hypothetical protein AAB036_12020 [Elusimicrobiota bacterium]